MPQVGRGFVQTQFREGQKNCFRNFRTTDIVNPIVWGMGIYWANHWDDDYKTEFTNLTVF